MCAHAITACLKLARVVLLAVPRNARRATLGSQSATMAQSVLVRVLGFTCAGKRVLVPMYICMVCECTGNTCVCKNGVGQTGVGCPAIGAEKCASCNAGFIINHERTKCIRTCACMCVCVCAQSCMYEQTLTGSNIVDFDALRFGSECLHMS